MRGGILISVDLLDNNIYKTNPTFTATNEIAEFTQPLKKIGLEYFTFDRHYNDNSRFSLTNSGKWIEHYWREKLYKNAIFEKDTSKFADGHVFWNWLQREPVYSAAADYGIDNGITLVDKQENYYDFLHFGAINNSSINNDYLIDKLHYLHQFSHIFKHKMYRIIQIAEKYKIQVPVNEFSASVAEKRISEGRVANSDFYGSLGKRDAGRIYLDGSFNNTWLTQREFKTMVLLTQGFSISEVAIQLNISDDAINKYVKNIKDKLNCKTLCELGCAIGKILAKNAYLFSFEKLD
jgi:DNA-binding CsgD family transcriptional regulator